MPGRDIQVTNRTGCLQGRPLAILAAKPRLGLFQDAFFGVGFSLSEESTCTELCAATQVHTMLGLIGAQHSESPYTRPPLVANVHYGTGQGLRAQPAWCSRIGLVLSDRPGLPHR